MGYKYMYIQQINGIIIIFLFFLLLVLLLKPDDFLAGRRRHTVPTAIDPYIGVIVVVHSLSISIPSTQMLQLLHIFAVCSW